MKTASVHRFQDLVALSLPGKGETVYLLPQDARFIASALKDCAADIGKRGFAASQFGGANCGLENDGSRFYKAPTLARTYRGVDIFPADRNASGIRWNARVAGEYLRADTLQGIKRLIKEALQ